MSLADVLKGLSGDALLHERMGEFICNYAKIEGMCHLVFDRLSGLPPEVARTMMGNARLADLLAVLTRVVNLSDRLTTEQKTEYKRCVDQLSAISTFRHGLIHRGASANQAQVTSSNELIAKSREAVEILKFHVDDIKHAADDCFRMEIRLLWLIVPDVKDRLGNVAAKVFGPWLYKQVRPERPYQPRKARRLKNRQLPS